jgi:hypothetical protein
MLGTPTDSSSFRRTWCGIVETSEAIASDEFGKMRLMKAIHQRRDRRARLARDIEADFRRGSLKTKDK